VIGDNMADNKKIPLVNVDNLIHKSNEGELFDDMARIEYFEFLSRNGYDYTTLKTLLENKRISSSEQSKFNSVLKKARDEIDVKVCESVVYLEEYFVKTKRILSLLDEEVFFILKSEMQKKYCIKLDTTNLDELDRISGNE
jgi:hypothetical protein